MSTIITDALSQKEIILLTSGLKKGFEAVDDLVLKYPFLKTKYALSAVSILYNVAVQISITQMVEDGILQGFTCRETPNFRKNHYFLEIENTSCVVHFKSNPWITPRNVGNSKLPRLSQFRKQRAVAQQLSLYPQDQYDMAESKCYFIFMYRNMGTSGSYIPAMCIGMPNQEYDGWIDIKDITNYPTVLSTDNTQQDYLKELKDQISLKISNIANEKYNS